MLKAKDHPALSEGLFVDWKGQQSACNSPIWVSCWFQERHLIPISNHKQMAVGRPHLFHSSGGWRDSINNDQQLYYHTSLTHEICRSSHCWFSLRRNSLALGTYEYSTDIIIIIIFFETSLLRCFLLNIHRFSEESSGKVRKGNCYTSIAGVHASSVARGIGHGGNSPRPCGATACAPWQVSNSCDASVGGGGSSGCWKGVQIDWNVWSFKWAW